MAGLLDVVMVTTSYPRFEGDFAGHFVASLASELASLGHRITVIAPHEPGTPSAEEHGNLSIRRVRYAPDRLERLAYGDGIVPNLKAAPVLALAVPGLARALRAAVREHAAHADVMHVHWAPTAVLADVAASRVPVALSLHGSDVTLATRGVLRRMLARGLRAADAAMAVADSQKQAIVSAGLYDGPIDIVPCGIPLELTKRPRPAGARDGAPAFIFVGRLVVAKGVLELLDAFGGIAADLPLATLSFVGKGPLASRLAELVQARGLTGRVELVGELPHERALELIAQADMLVLPSHGEGSPLSVTEALALGTPVLSTPVGAVRELVGDAGIIVPVSDVGALADALKSFALHPDAVQAAAHRARARMEGEYGWPVIAERTLCTYRRAIERRGGAS